MSAKAGQITAIPDQAEETGQCDTYFASSERAPTDCIRTSAEQLDAQPNIASMLDAFPGPAVVLNDNRQIVAANAQLAKLLQKPAEALPGLFGQRVGEVLECVHAEEGPGGCGTSEACSQCGAAHAMLECIEYRRPSESECRILVGNQASPDALDILASAAPLQATESPYTIFSVRDISAVKRRESMERLFFHDVLNVAGGIQGLVEWMIETGGKSTDIAAESFSHRVERLVRQLVEQIRSFRDLTAAENGELCPTFTDRRISELFSDLAAAYETHPVANERVLTFEPPKPAELAVHSDAVLLQRVLGNLIKNALEATAPGGTVTVRCLSSGEQVRFEVHNAEVIPPEIQFQIFKRSFSTKPGKGRGLGTFSVKLLVTRYLGGRVEFESHPGRGTAFIVTLPAGRSNGQVGGDRDPINAAAMLRLDGLRVLVVDDAPENRRLLEFFLSHAGAEVACVNNGRQAVDQVFRTPLHPDYDVILMDIQMPELDGCEATKMIRDAGFKGVIVMLTATVDTEEQDRCLQAGCDAYATKPIGRSHLLEIIRRHTHAMQA